MNKLVIFRYSLIEFKIRRKNFSFLSELLDLTVDILGEYRTFYKKCLKCFQGFLKTRQLKFGKNA
jgi:hypothetical protein